MLAKGCNSISCFTRVCCHDRVSEERAIAWTCVFMWLAGWGASSWERGFIKNQLLCCSVKRLCGHTLLTGRCFPKWLQAMKHVKCVTTETIRVCFYTSLCVPAHLNHIQVCKSCSDRRNIVVSLSTFIHSDSGMFISKSAEKQTCAKIQPLHEMLQLITNKSAFS